MGGRGEEDEMKCQRCGKETLVHSMSWFNTQEICMECRKEERAHPDFEKAKQAEEAMVRMGNFNFDGIGWPGKDGRVK